MARTKGSVAKPKNVIEKPVNGPSKKPDRLALQQIQETVQPPKTKAPLLKPTKKGSPVWDFLSSYFELQTLTFDQVGGKKFARARRHLVCRECHSFQDAIAFTVAQENKGSKPYKQMHVHLATHGIEYDDQAMNEE